MVKKILYCFGLLMLVAALVKPLASITHAQDAGGSPASGSAAADTNAAGNSDGPDPCNPDDTTYSGAEKCLPFSAQRILAEINPGATEMSWPEIFATSDPEKAGQNLYETIYRMNAVEPAHKAAQNMAGKYGVSEAEMTQLIYGNIAPILKRSPLVTQEQAIQKLNEIQQQFQEEQDLLALRADIEASVEPPELFVNGSVADSGFDLVDDLSLIEKILFLKSAPPSVGGNFQVGGSDANAQAAAAALNSNLPGQNPDNTGKAASAVVDGGSAGSSNQNGAGNQSGNLSASGSANKNNNVNQNGGLKLSTNTNNVGSPGSASTPLVSPSDNPNVCFGQSNSLSQALEQFDKENPSKLGAVENAGSGANGTDRTGTNQAAASANQPASAGSNGASGSGQQNLNNNSASNSGASAESNTGTAASDLTADPLANFTPQENSAPAQSAPAGQWLKSGDCKDTFCLSVNFVKKPVELYQNTDDCILCHLEKINAKLRQTVEHSLIPGKATGNLLEPQICKKSAATALQSIGMNFYAMSRPVQTPANDDLIYGTNIEEEWKSFLATYKPFPVDEANPKPSEDGTGTEVPPSELDVATKTVVADADSSTPIDQIQKKIEEQLTTNQTARQQQIYVVEQALQSDIDVGFYQAIRREVEQMNYYFDSFKDILHSLHEKVDGIAGEQACTSLKNKPVCS